MLKFAVLILAYEAHDRSVFVADLCWRNCSIGDLYWVGEIELALTLMNTTQMVFDGVLLKCGF